MMRAIIKSKNSEKQKNEIVIEGEIKSKYFNTDKSGKPYCKLMIIHTNISKNTKKFLCPVKCYLYNTQYNIVKNNGFHNGDLVNIVGSLQNRNDDLTIFVKNIKKI